jgi:acetyl esterase/lipase
MPGFFPASGGFMTRPLRGRLAAVLRTTMVCSTALLISACQTVAFSVLNSGGDALPATESITYDENLGLKLDVHRAAGQTARPPIAVFFYGGSWRNGNRGEYAFVGAALAGAGITTVIPDYRVFPQGRFPDFEVDAAHAVRWAFDHAAELGGDPHRIFLIGHSAGAHIAALLGTDRRYLASAGITPTELAGIIGISGPYDFLPLTDPDLIEVFGEARDWPASQPVNFVDGDEPPFLLLHGQDDRIVLPQNSLSLLSKLRDQKVSAKLITYPSVGHFRIIAAFRFTGLAPSLRDSVEFMLSDKH